MNKIGTAILIILGPLFLNAQGHLVKSWDYRFGGEELDFPYAFVQSFDKGFLLAGNSFSQIGFEKSDSARGNSDYWLVRCDSNGIKIWDKAFGGDNYDGLNSAIQLKDSGFLIGGYSKSGITGDKSEDRRLDTNALIFDCWILRLDKDGNKIWDRTFGGVGDDRVTSLLELADGSFLAGGFSFSDSSYDFTHHSFGKEDYWVIKMDSSGNLLWENNFGGSDYDVLQSMMTTGDNGVMLAGYSKSPADGNKSSANCDTSSIDYWIVKLDSNGTKQWDKNFGSPCEDYCTVFSKLTNNKYVVGGISQSEIGVPSTGCQKTAMNHSGSSNIYTDFWLVCFDEAGNILWDKIYGGYEHEDELNSIVQTRDGALISGTSYSNISGEKTQNNILNSEQCWVFEIDTMGNKLWDKTIDSNNHSESCYGLQTKDSCFVFLSHVRNSGGDVSQARASLDDYWLVKYCYSQLPPVANFLTFSNEVCQRTCINFDNLSQEALSYQWIFPGATPSSDTSVSPQGICYDSSGNYDVTLIAYNPYGTDTLQLSSFIHVLPEVSFAPITQTGDTLFSVPGLQLYEWYLNHVAIVNSNNWYYVAPVSGSYMVVATDSNGCNAVAEKLNVIAAVDGDIVSREIEVSCKDHQLILSSQEQLGVGILLLDLSGKILFERSLFCEKGENLLNLDNSLASGIYFVRINYSGKTIVRMIRVDELR